MPRMPIESERPVARHCTPPIRAERWHPPLVVPGHRTRRPRERFPGKPAVRYPVIFR